VGEMARLAGCLALEGAGDALKGVVVTGSGCAAGAHDSHGVMRRMWELHRTQKKSDITIKVESCEFECHRAVLSCRSLYFNNMFTLGFSEATGAPDDCPTESPTNGDPSEFRPASELFLQEHDDLASRRGVSGASSVPPSSVTLQSISADVFEHVVAFAYDPLHGPNIPPAMLSQVLELSRFLGMPSLQRLCEQRLIQHINVKTVIQIFHFAIEMRCAFLLYFTLRFLRVFPLPHKVKTSPSLWEHLPDAALHHLSHWFGVDLVMLRDKRRAKDSGEPRDRSPAPPAADGEQTAEAKPADGEKKGDEKKGKGKRKTAKERREEERTARQRAKKERETAYLKDRFRRVTDILWMERDVRVLFQVLTHAYFGYREKGDPGVRYGTEGARIGGLTATDEDEPDPFDEYMDRMATEWDYTYRPDLDAEFRLYYRTLAQESDLRFLHPPSSPKSLSASPVTRSGSDLCVDGRGVSSGLGRQISELIRDMRHKNPFDVLKEEMHDNGDDDDDACESDEECEQDKLT